MGIKAPNGSVRFGFFPVRIRTGTEVEPNRTDVSVQILPIFAKKCKNRNNSASSDRNKAFYSSLESSHRDESNGGKTKSLASLHDTISSVL